MSLKTVILLAYVVCLSHNPKCQIGTNALDFVNLSGEVKLVDSQYLFIYKLSVTNDEKVYVDKKIYFDQDPCNSIAPGRFFLRKIVRRVGVNIFVSATRHFDELPDFGKKTQVSKNSPHMDSVILDNVYPFEIGDYFLSAEIDVSYKSQKFSIGTNDIYFSVPYLPKSSIFD